MSVENGKKTEQNQETQKRLSRRDFIKYSAGAAAVAASTSTLLGKIPSTSPQPSRSSLWPQATSMATSNIEELTIAQMQAMMAAGTLSALSLLNMYLARITALDQNGPVLNSILQINPDATAIAMQLDAERSAGHVRGPLHGIPILLKDNIDTHDSMQTAAGSLALVGTPALQDSTVVANLRAAGAMILGKTNMSEWANFRAFFSSSGWSGRAGQCLNPYFLDRNPCGSSSGSGIAPSANLVAASIGTETDGSIVCPANANGVVGIKPTLGLTSRAGVVPISHSQDTVGPHGRTVADAAAVLSAIVSKTPDPRDPATSANRDKIPADYTAFVNPNGLKGARIGVARVGVTGFSGETDGIFDAAIAAMSSAGAVIVDPADIPTIDQINQFAEEIVVLIFEFKRDLNAYLATRTGVPIGTLADAIQFNLDHADQELKWFGQELFELAEADIFNRKTYLNSLATERLLGGRDGIDAVLKQFNLDAIVAPTGSPAWTTDLVNGDHFLGASSSPAAIAGYPIINVPAGNAFGLPVGISFMGTALSEPALIRLASGFEAVTRARQKPQFQSTLPLGNPTAPRGRRRARIPTASRPLIGLL